MAKVFKLRRFGHLLWESEKVTTIRGMMDQQLASLEPGELLLVDATGVDMLDFVFAQDLIGRILLELPVTCPGSFLALTGMSPHVTVNIQKALEDMDLICLMTGEKGWELMGKNHPADGATLRAIAQSPDGLTARELAAAFNVKLTAMNQRVSKLLKRAILRREKCLSPSGREEYRYKAAPQPTE
jgi:hypothetical protein